MLMCSHMYPRALALATCICFVSWSISSLDSLCLLALLLLDLRLARMFFPRHLASLCVFRLCLALACVFPRFIAPARFFCFESWLAKSFVYASCSIIGRSYYFGFTHLNATLWTWNKNIYPVFWWFRNLGWSAYAEFYCRDYPSLFCDALAGTKRGTFAKYS